MTEKTLASPKPSGIPIANNFKKVFRQYGGILSGMVVLIILFSFINDSFFTANNITNIILQVSIIAITAYGMTYVLLLGDIDLSVGSTIALIGTFAALGASWGIPFVLLVPLSIIAALALGMINGGLTAIAGIPSFIVTVATMGIFRGIAYIVTDGMPIMIKDDAFLALGNGEFLYIPIPIWILIILLLINHFILTKTTFGRKIYITGGNKEAAIYSGINVTRLKIKVFMITAVLAGISGMILASRLYSGQPNSALSYELDAIAAAVLGGTSLSVGSTIALIGTFAALGASWGIPFVLLVPLSIIAALALGMINGGLTAIAGIPSFIVTVATMGIFRGIAYIVTDGMPIMIKDDAFLALGNGEFLYIPIPIWILIILLLINHFILTKTTFGRKIYITGGNKEAAIYSGINVTRLKIKVFMITAVLAGISGMILASRLYSGQPNSALSYELDAIAAAVLGGTSLNGGYGTVVGTVIGALTIGVINNGMNLMNVPYFYQMVVKGLVILVAVYFDVRNKRKRS